MLTLLQIPLTTDSVNAAIESVPVTTMPESGFSIFDMLVKGGYIMIPIANLSNMETLLGEEGREFVSLFKGGSMFISRLCPLDYHHYHPCIHLQHDPFYYW